MSSSARIDELRRKFDENPRRYFAPLANEYRKAGDFDQAIFICQEYLPQQPGHMSGHIVFGQALFEAKRLPEARTVFETALTLDPENLIALRHLAEISRALGELGPARVWYERVLQADPRNEEVAAIMASMAAAPGASGSSPIAPTAETPAMVTTPAPATAPAAAAPTMELSAAAVQEMLKARQAAQAAPAAPAAPAAQAAIPEAQPEVLSLDDAATVEINSVAAPPTIEGFESTRSEETFEVPSGGMLGFEPTSAAAPPSEPIVQPPSLEGLDTLTLDDFSVPTTVPPTVPTTVPTTVPGAQAPPPPVPESSDGLMDLGSFGFPAPTPEPTPPVTPIAEPVASPPDLSIDGEPPGMMDFELDIPSGPLDAATEPETVPTVVMDAIPEIIVPPLEPLDEVIPLVAEEIPAVVEEIPTVVETAQAPTVIMEAVRVSPPQSEAPEPAVVPEPTLPEKPAGAAPFVTETMAQLYLDQGHRAEAIDIYRKLVAARPNDAALRGRLEALEASDAAPAQQITQETAPVNPASGSTAAVAPVRSRFASGGPTIREVLRELFGVDARSASGNGEAHAEPGAEVGSIDVLFSAGAVADAPSPLAVAFDGGYVAASGTIDQIFAGGGR